MPRVPAGTADVHCWPGASPLSCPACNRGAARFAEGEIRRLLSGRVDMFELAMTGGMWRVTGEQVCKPCCAGDRLVLREVLCHSRGNAPAGPDVGNSRSRLRSLAFRCGCWWPSTPLLLVHISLSCAPPPHTPPPPPTTPHPPPPTPPPPPPQVERAAAGEGGPQGPSDEVKGPHNALSVRLVQRDPGRSFVLVRPRQHCRRAAPLVRLSALL